MPTLKEQKPIYFNPNRKVTVDNESDYLGTISEGFGIDLKRSNDVDCEVGDIAVGQKLYPQTDDTDVASLGLVKQAVISDCDSIGTIGNPTLIRTFAVGDVLVKSAEPDTTKFTKDTTTDYPTAPTGEMAVLGKMPAYENAISGSGTLTTSGLSQFISSTDTMVAVKFGSKINITASVDVAGGGSLYTKKNGGDVWLFNENFDLRVLKTGTVIKGNNPANPSNPINVTVVAVWDWRTIKVSASVDIPYGISNWTYNNGVLATTTLTAAGDGNATGIQVNESIDLTAGVSSWTYQLQGALVDNLLVATATDIWMKTQGAWTKNYWTSYLSQRPFRAAPLFCPMESLGRLYIIDKNYVSYLDRRFNYAVPHQDVNLFLDGYIADWVVGDDYNLYIGTHNPSTGSAGVWVYQPLAALPVTGISTQYEGDMRFYDMNAPYGGSGVGWLWKNVLYVLHPDGTIKGFNGSGFDTVARTPAHKKNVPFNVARHGVVADGDTFWFLTAGKQNAYAAGVWRCDTDTWNFYHWASCVTRKHVAGETGQLGESYLSAASLLYWDGTDWLAGVTAKDGYGGSTEMSEILCSINTQSVPKTLGAWFATARVVFGETQASLFRLWTKYATYGTDKIRMKFRSRSYAKGTPSGRDEDSVTWTTYVPPSGPPVYGIEFTTTADISEVKVGDEVTITRGANAGLNAHVAAISLGGGTYTVLLDEAIGLSTSATSYVTFRTWQKMSDFTNVQAQSQDTTIPYGNNPCEWVQFKAEIHGEDSLIKELRLEKQLNEK